MTYKVKSRLTILRIEDSELNNLKRGCVLLSMVTWLKMRGKSNRKANWLLLNLLGIMSFSASAQVSGPGADARRDATVQAVEMVMPAVVNIATETVINVRDPFEEMLRQYFDPYYRRRPANSQLSLGSGVIIDEEGYILTNDHVVRRADKIWVKVYTNNTPYEAKLISSNSRSDVALIKLQGKPGEKFKAVKFAGDDDLLLGETVLALGNPFGLGGSVSKGILSSKSRNAPKESDQLDWHNWLQTDASVNPGNSGGPLVNLRGELIGINVAILKEAQGICFAIPIKQVSEALSEILTPESSEKSLWFGARVKIGSQLIVTSVQPQSPADKAGLKVGDQILKINGLVPKGFIDFNQQLLKSPKQEAILSIERKNDLRTVSVQMMPEKEFFNADLLQRILGIRLQELTPQLARAMRLTSTDGFVVVEVDQSTASTGSLQPGWLVTAINGQTPPNLVSAAKLLYGKKKGEKVELEILAQGRRGVFPTYLQGKVEIPIQ